MVTRKLGITIEMTEFILCVWAQFIFAMLFYNNMVIAHVFLYAFLMTICAAVCLILINNKMISQTGFIICIVITTQLIGKEMGTLAFGLCVYMLSGTLISIAGDRKLNIRHIIIVNIAILYGLIVEYDTIVREIPIEGYVILILFCEVFLITENYVVTLYQQKVAEVERQNELLNVAKESKGEFLANMSHEIRTPMNVIVGTTELIMREENISEKIKDYCYNIRSSGENLLGIINDILDFSKIESGKMDIIYEPYSIASVVQDVANTAMFRRGFKDIEIIIDCSPTMPKQLVGDVLRNRQILMNLVTNAVKYTEEGLVFISLSCYDQGGVNWLHMEVKDTGIGIKKEDQKQLFDSFIRLDTMRNRSVEGTGLGLAICKRLTQIMNGSIHIESEYGVGTTVKVDIPQEVEDSAPFLAIENAQDMKVVMFGDRDQYMQNAHDYYQIANSHTWDGLGVSYRVILTFSELIKAVENNEVTHLYTGAEEYANQRNYFDNIAKKVGVFVLHDPQYPIKLGDGVRGVHMPFYSINLASSINGESFYNQYINKKEVRISFKAPSVRALIVDDNDVNLMVAEGVLKLYDVNCILACSGAEAIEVLKNQDIDIVFMDHMMPEMDGIEATKIIRRIGGEYGKNLPIIALTGNAVNDAKEMFLNNGFQDFIAKPISIKHIDSVLRRWISETKIELIDEADKKEIPSFDKEKATVMSDKGFTCMRIDEKVALENMGEQRDLFKELLEYCLELEEQRKQEINESFEQQDWPEYIIRVHALKGGMRSLGVEELALVAQAQELAGKENRIDDVMAGHAHLMQEYERGHRSIEEYLKSFIV